MAQKVWTSEGEFVADWDLVNLLATGGTLTVVAPTSVGTATMKAAYQGTGWAEWVRVRLGHTMPGATSISLQARSGTSKVLAEAAAWSADIPDAGLDGSGNLMFPIPAALSGAGEEWIQLALSLHSA